MLAATKVKMSGSDKKKRLTGTLVVVQINGKEMYKKVCSTCKVVFLDLLLLFFTALAVFTISLALHDFIFCFSKL